jgi:hypothetical protein
VQQKAAKKLKRGSTAELEYAQAQAVKLALEAAKAVASRPQPRLSADMNASALQAEDSGSLNARRQGRRTPGSEMSDAVSKEKKKRKKKSGGVDRKGGEDALDGVLEAEPLREHWEPIRLQLPEIKWRGDQRWLESTAGMSRSGGTQSALQRSDKCWSTFSLNKNQIIAALDAALAKSSVQEYDGGDGRIIRDPVIMQNVC